MGSLFAPAAPLAERTRAPTERVHRRDAIICAAWALALLLVLFAPLLTGGTVLLLDQADVPIGPHATLGSYTFGFPPGLTSRAPITASLLALFRTLPLEPLKLVPLVAYVPIAALGLYRLFDRRALPTVAATTLFVVNPFTLERLFAGQAYILLGYALLPLAVWLATKEPTWRSGVSFGLIFSLQAAFSIHFVFITGVLAILAWLLGPGAFRKRTLMFLVAACVSLVASAYWLIPIASHSGELDQVTLHDVALFGTRADPVLGLVPNLLALRGFWRATSTLQHPFPGWLVCMIALLAVAALGASASAKERPRRRVMLAAATVGIILACGAAGLSGDAFVWAFEHVPGFRVMREPQKFVALYALGLAWAFGLGVEYLVRGTRSEARRRVLAMSLCAVPLAASFPMMVGLWVEIRPSHYPASWTAADAIMGSGSGRILALPGDAYVSFSWTQDRAVANPMTSFFSRDIVSDGNVELGGLESQTSNATSRYLSFLTTVGSRTRNFGNLVAPLDVQFVLLAKTEDWARYRWLLHQDDLTVVHRWPDLVLFRNEEPSSLAYQPGSSLTVRDWGQVVGLASSTRLTDVAVHVRHPTAGPIRIPPMRAAPPAPSAAAHVASNSVTALTVDTARDGPLVIARTFDDRWSATSGPITANLGVELLVPASGEPVTLEYEGWPPARTAYAISMVGLSVLLGVRCLLSFLHRRSGMLPTRRSLIERSR
jgi:hypothetical protein